jgi:hypothetical protein
MTLEHLRERAARANRQDFIDFLEESPAVPPVPGRATNSESGSAARFLDCIDHLTMTISVDSPSWAFTCSGSRNFKICLGHLLICRFERFA